MNPHKLERYAFLWSEARLIVGAIALLIGGVPPIYLVAPPSLFGIAKLGLTIAWLISGVSALYLVYRWSQHGQKVFGKKDTRDMAAFFILVVSGINLGLVPLLHKNVGMTIANGRLIFFVAAALYIFAAYHLYNTWKKSGEKLF